MLRKKKLPKYYRLDRILKIPATYYMIISGRNDGKTYAVTEYGLTEYLEKGTQMAIIRRRKEDMVGKRARQMFENLVCNGEGKNRVEELSHGEWNDIRYTGGCWYLCKRYTDKDGEDQRIDDMTPFAYGFSLTDMEHDKSTAYPKVMTILFDEFMSRNTNGLSYLDDEFITFMNVLSSIIRRRKGVKIFMAGNTVNKDCPYFQEMGLKKIRELQPGDIQEYSYGKSNLKVVVEFAQVAPKDKEVNEYFAFDNPKLSMITGEGEVWELGSYPHLPIKYKTKNIIFTYFVIYGEDILQCEIISVGDNLFTYIHRKTTPIKQEDSDLVFSKVWDVRPNFRRNILRPMTKAEQRIGWFFKNDKVFYQDNDIGDMMWNYIQWCKSN